MRTVFSAAFVLAAGILVASGASAAPSQNASRPTANSETEMADTGGVALRGNRDDSDDGSQAARDATAGPRRLSALAGSDEQAWASAHSITAIEWRRARKSPPH